jgi:NhaC family Na+:H+ antiporter
MTDPPKNNLPEDAAPKIREPSYLDAFIPLVTLVVLIGGAVLLFGVAAVDGPVPVALILCFMVTALVLLKNGYTWEDVTRGGKIAFESIVTPIFILLSVGALIGTWNRSGTIPTLVYYGVKLLHPTYFYIASLVICGITSLSIGSSWTTAGAIGHLPTPS